MQTLAACFHQKFGIALGCAVSELSLATQPDRAAQKPLSCHVMVTQHNCYSCCVATQLQMKLCNSLWFLVEVGANLLICQSVFVDTFPIILIPLGLLAFFLVSAYFIRQAPHLDFSWSAIADRGTCIFVIPITFCMLLSLQFCIYYW